MICKRYRFLITAGFVLSTSILLPAAVAAQNRGIASTHRPDKESDARTALVIGNSNYRSSPLKNPANDAKLMADTLKSSGFSVEMLVDVSQNEMKRAILKFGRKLRAEGGVGLFYFAGHGMQVGGQNYLIPVNAPIESERDVEIEAVAANYVTSKMADANNLMNIVILDACRNNPFARSFRSSSNGLAFMDAPSGTLVAYATSPGSVAADGTNNNGVYTEQLVRAMQQEGARIEDVFKVARLGVQGETDGNQTPWESSSLTGNFYFFGTVIINGDPGYRPPPPIAVQSSPEPLVSERFEFLDDGFILDKKNKVVWFAPEVRQTYTWKQAQVHVAALKERGYTNWRLPKEDEIDSVREEYKIWLRGMGGNVRTAAGARYWLDSISKWGRAEAITFLKSAPGKVEGRAQSEKMWLLMVAPTRGG